MVRAIHERWGTLNELNYTRVYLARKLVPEGKMFFMYMALAIRRSPYWSHWDVEGHKNVPSPVWINMARFPHVN